MTILTSNKSLTRQPGASHQPEFNIKVQPGSTGTIDHAERKGTAPETLDVEGRAQGTRQAVS